VHVHALRRVWGLLAASLSVAAVFVPGAAARVEANPSLDVTFFANGQISVTLADGTSVGTTSGSPTVIPAGYYQVLLNGPGGCVQLPSFDLEGPGVSTTNNLDDGEVQSTGFNAYFAPNSTFTWRDTGITGTVNTFSTSNTILGTSPAVGSNQAPVTSGGTNSTSTDVVGSKTAMSKSSRPLTKIVGTITAAGKLSVALDGKSVTTLLPGMYSFVVTDRSSVDGFLLRKAGQRTIVLTGAAFTGRRTTKIDLTAGRWLFIRGAGRTSFSITVS
jgi:hypothetical protein